MSGLFPRPAWQTGVGVPNGNMRLIPDVSAAADPNTGAFLVLGGSATQIGGTSWSAPIGPRFARLSMKRVRKPVSPSCRSLTL